jgi:hypothetical protein
MGYCVGLDWGGSAHAVCIIDDAGGRVVEHLEVPHTADGIHAMLGRLARRAPPAELAIAIERPSGLIVDALVAAGHPVVPIHPNVVKAVPPALPRRWRQERSGRRLYARRHPAHGWSSLPAAAPVFR